MVAVADRTPAEFVHDALVDNLRALGLQIVDSPTSAARIIDGELVRFWTTETNLYRTEVRSVFTVRRPSGAVLWRGSAGGSAKRFGRSLKAGNYQQVYSDATLQMIENLVTNPGFQEALHNASRAGCKRPDRTRRFAGFLTWMSGWGASQGDALERLNGIVAFELFRPTWLRVVPQPALQRAAAMNGAIWRTAWRTA